MNIKKVLITGLKIVAAVATGVAIFIGLGKTFEGSRKKNTSNSATGRENSNNNQQNFSSQPQEGKEEKTTSQKIVHGFKKFQDSCGKLFGVAQALSTVADNLHKIFNNNYQPQLQDNYSNYNNSGSLMGFNRISPNIVEVGFLDGNTQQKSNNKYLF